MTFQSALEKCLQQSWHPLLAHIKQGYVRNTFTGNKILPKVDMWSRAVGTQPPTVQKRLEVDTVKVPVFVLKERGDLRRA